MPAKIPSEVLLEKIREFYSLFNRPPTVGDFRRDDRFPDPTVYSNRFGSWSEALKLAGIPYNRNPWSKTSLIKWVRVFKAKKGQLPRGKDLHASLGAPEGSTIRHYFGTIDNFYVEAGFGSQSIKTPGKQEFIDLVQEHYNKHGVRPRASDVLTGPPFTQHYLRKCGIESFEKLLLLAGISPYRHTGWTKSQVVGFLWKLFKSKGRPITIHDVNTEKSGPSASWIRRIFGSFTEALKYAGIPQNPGRFGLLWPKWQKHCEKVAQALYGKEIRFRKKQKFGYPDIYVPREDLIIEVMTSSYNQNAKRTELRNYLGSGKRVHCWCIWHTEELSHRNLIYIYPDKLSQMLKRIDKKGLAAKTIEFFNYSDRHRKQDGLYTRKELIGLLRALAREVGHPPSREEINNKPGYPSAATFERQLGDGSHYRAVERAGLKPSNRYRSYTSSELVKILQRIARELGHTPTIEELRCAKDCPHPNTFINRFGSYNKALVAAGLRPRRVVKVFPRD